MSSRPSVFLNCPFDEDYQGLFQAILFTILECGFEARTALETQDSGTPRIQKIVGLIGECRLGIHDLSRIELNTEGLPRFNMPLELGIFLGAQWLGSEEQRRKQCLVLDRDKFRYQRFCSDIAGQDIAQHENRPEAAIKAVRDFLTPAASRAGLARPPGAKAIVKRIADFRQDLPLLCEAQKVEVSELTYGELINFIKEWQNLGRS